MNGKIYTDRMLWVGTFLGGPLVAGYLFASNFKLFGKRKEAQNSIYLAIGISILLFFLVLLIPENVNVPRIIIPLTYSVVASGLFQHYQGAQIKEHLKMDGGVQSWWRVILITLISILLLIVLGIVVFVFMDLVDAV